MNWDQEDQNTKEAFRLLTLENRNKERSEEILEWFELMLEEGIYTECWGVGVRNESLGNVRLKEIHIFLVKMYGTRLNWVENKPEQKMNEI